MGKLKMQTANKADENFKKLAAMFPNAVTETIDENGEVVRAIDKDVLMQEISCKVVDGNEERYQFTWPDKKKSVLLANASINKTLRPCREESVDFDNTENIYIEGDNLEVLKLLQETYLGKIKMIYIDPPYNTGNDFVYEDDFAQSTDEYLANSGQFDDEGNRLVKNLDSNGRFHTDWLNMIYPRLRLAKDLLSDDGVIFISIDDNEIDSLKNICNEIFGMRNLVAEIPWQSRASIQNDTDFSVNHEYICVYAKNRRQENRRLKENNYNEWHSRDSFVCKPLPLDKSKFDNPDNDPRGLWKAAPFDAPNVRPNLTYVVTNPLTGEQHLPPSGRHWRISQDKFSSALEDGRIIFGKNGTGRPQMKFFYEEKKEFGSVDNSWFSSERVGTTTNGTKEVMQLFDGRPYFDKPKPTTLLCKLIDLANVQDSDIILDFFSGSATTAHAVMQLNADDGGHRKFIMVQLPEEIDEKSEAYKSGYKNVCEIGKERIRRAAIKIIDESFDKRNIKKGLKSLYKEKMNLEELQDEKWIEMYCNGEISLEVLKNQFNGTGNTIEEISQFIEELQLLLKSDTENIDLGFRVLKCDSSNMKDVYYNPADYEPSLFSNLEDNIKEDRTPEDLLFQVMLDLGILLSSKIKETVIGGKKVFNVEDNYLIACFDDNVTEEVITEIAKQKPYYFVMRDSSMANDSVATNFEQIFAAYSPDTVRKVL